MTAENDINTNNLKSIRMTEGLKITELSKLSDVSTKVISEIERYKRKASPVTKHKIVKGLNSHSSKSKDYLFSDIFPNDDTE